MIGGMVFHEHVKSSFPFNHSSEYNSKVRELTVKIWETVENDFEAKFIIVSHVGPKCNTSIGKALLKTEYEGSEEWNRLIYEFKDRIIMFLHGHTHWG